MKPNTAPKFGWMFPFDELLINGYYDYRGCNEFDFLGFIEDQRAGEVLRNDYCGDAEQVVPVAA